MGGAFRAALVKDFRLLVRDRVGLVFLTLAPIVVISVAGLSLANLYGGGVEGTSAFLVPVVDEDGGDVGRTLRERLAREDSIELRLVESRDAARELVRRKHAGVALIVPAGTSRDVAEGHDAALLLYTDPVKSIEVATVRAITQELRHGIEEAARARAEAGFARARTGAEAARAAFTQAGDALAQQLEMVSQRLASAWAQAERQAAASERALHTTLAARRDEARARLAAELRPLQEFLRALRVREQDFTAWLAAARETAGRFADRLPPPPEAPAVPPALASLATTDVESIVARVLPPDGGLPELPRLALPPLPRVPTLDLPPFPVPPAAALPGPLAIVERSVTGAPARLNTFDQNVPGFGVTFLLLGVLLGVSLGLLDERDWGTLDRLRATSTPLATVLVAKLTARALVGLLQMTLLFGVGWLVFGVSLGPEPWGLLLPTAGIVLAGTAFGLVVAGLTASREAVLPLGSIAVLTMAAAGGCWWPIDLEPRWMRSAALAFPTTWAMDAYNDLMIRRLPTRAVVESSAVLFAYAALYLVAGLLLFRRRVVRGA